VSATLVNLLSYCAHRKFTLVLLSALTSIAQVSGTHYWAKHQGKLDVLCILGL
jgi:hypothetical protein